MEAERMIRRPEGLKNQDYQILGIHTVTEK